RLGLAIHAAGTGRGGPGVGQVQHHAGPAVEETGLHVEGGASGAADGSQRLGELVVGSAGEVAPEDQTDAGAADRQVGQGAKALVDVQLAAGLASHAAPEVLPQSSLCVVEERSIAGALVHANE